MSKASDLYGDGFASIRIANVLKDEFGGQYFIYERKWHEYMFKKEKV